MNKPRKIARTMVRGYVVSTVSLGGLDHNYTGIGPSLLFESMLFPNEVSFHELACERYSTEAEAKAGHWDMVARVEAGALP